MDKAELIRHKIEKRKEHNLAIGNPLFAAMAEADIELLCFIDSLQEEPVNENFEEALAQEWKGYNDRGAATVDALEDNTQELAFAKGFYRGSKWQEKQDQETIELAEDHAILAGMEKMKKQIMAIAVDGIARPYDNEIWCILDSFNLKDGDEVKVIVIKKK